MAALQRCLSADPRDVPFGACLSVAPKGRVRTLCGARLRPARRAAPAATARYPGTPWPFARCLGRAGLDLPGETNAGRPEPRWQHKAWCCRSAPGGRAGVGYLVAGLNPHRGLDAGYKGFIELLTAPGGAGSRAGRRVRARTIPCQGARGTRPRQDHVLLQRQPRISHAADADARARSRICSRKATGLTPAAKGRLEIVHRNSLRLLKLVNTLLDFSRIEAGRIQARYERVDLASLTARTRLHLPRGVRACRSCASS